MRKILTLLFIMLFICVYPASQSQAKKDGIHATGDALVGLGERELGRGNTEGAIHEFQKALMVEPGHEKAIHYLEELGVIQGVSTIHSGHAPYLSRVSHRMQIISDELDRLESQRESIEHKMNGLKTGCQDYLENIDQRAQIATRCDGSKKLKPYPWSRSDSFISDFFEKSSVEEVAPGQDDSDYLETAQFGEGEAVPANVQEKKAEEDMALAPYVSAPVRSEQDYTDLYVQERAWDAPVYPTSLLSLADFDHMDEINHDLVTLEKQYDYEVFLRESYIQSQHRLANAYDLNELQYVQLVKLQEELDISGEKIDFLLEQREDFMNFVVHEVEHMQETGRLE